MGRKVDRDSMLRSAIAIRKSRHQSAINNCHPATRPHCMRAMLVANIDVPNGFANGASGRIVHWGPEDAEARFDCHLSHFCDSRGYSGPPRKWPRRTPTHKILKKEFQIELKWLIKVLLLEIANVNHRRRQP